MATITTIQSSDVISTSRGTINTNFSNLNTDKIEADSVDTLTNKTFDADGTGNSITNIENADIKAAAAIDASKIADGSVSNAEFQYLGSVTSDIQTQLNAKGTLSNVSEDTTPQLGGSLDVNGQSIVSVSAGNITITPDTTGDVIIDGLKYPQADGTTGQVLKTDGAGQLSWTTITPGSGDVVGPASSVDGELALFDSTTGKLIKRASSTGIIKTTSGVIGTASAGTDYVEPSVSSLTSLGTVSTSLTGVLRADSGVLSADTDVTDIVTAATDSAAGKVELATAAETTTGTDTGRAVTPDGLAGSNFGIRTVQVKVVDDATELTTGDGKLHFFVPPELNGMNLVDADAGVSTVSSSGTPTVQIHNVTDAQDMLSTAITIDASEKTSYTAAVAPVINATYDDVATGDELRIDVDVAGTGTKGLTVILSFQLP